MAETLFLQAADNEIASATITSTSEDSDFPHENLYDSLASKPFKFNSAGADDYITFDLGSAMNIDFASIHGHNIDSGITAARLYSKATAFSGSATDGTLEATFSVITPAFYVKLTNAVNRRYWRFVFIGTNGNPIKICEAFLGQASAFSSSFGVRFPYTITHIRPKIVNRLPSGERKIINLTSQRNRVLRVDFSYLRADYETARDDLFEASDDGALPLVFVPDDSKPEVVFGRVNPDGDWDVERSHDIIYEFQLTFVESPFDARVQ